jgi:peptidylprolyl isomerase
MKMHVLPAGIVMLMAAGLAGCGNDPFAIPADAVRTPSGIASKVLQPGLGAARPTLDSRVTVHYTGWTADGREFESSVKRGVPATFGVTEVIPGWTEILLQMVKGEKRRVWIPGPLAYDSDPRPDAPRGTLIFDIEVIDIR